MSTARQIRLLLVTAFCSLFLLGQTAHIATKVAHAMASVAPSSPNQAKAHLAAPEKQQFASSSKRSAPLPPYQLPAAVLLALLGCSLRRRSLATQSFPHWRRLSLSIAPQHPRFALRV